MMMSGGGAGRSTIFQEIRSGAGFETGDFLKKCWGGYPGTTLNQKTNC